MFMFMIMRLDLQRKFHQNRVQINYIYLPNSLVGTLLYYHDNHVALLLSGTDFEERTKASNGNPSTFGNQWELTWAKPFIFQFASIKSSKNSKLCGQPRKTQLSFENNNKSSFLEIIHRQVDQLPLHKILPPLH